MNTFEKLSLDFLNRKYLNVCIKSVEEFPYCRILNDFAKQCDSITEVNSIKTESKPVFTWCMLRGLVSNVNTNKSKSFVSIFFNSINKETKYARDLFISAGHKFDILVNKTNKRIENKTDMLFINTNFEYDYLKEVMDFNADMVNKYIIIYDNKFIEMIKKNVFNLGGNEKTMSIQNDVNDFLNTNKDWGIVTAFNTEYGMTVLQKLEDV
jgi:hypothetical protein